MNLERARKIKHTSRFTRCVALILCLVLNLQWLTAAAQPLFKTQVSTTTIVQTDGDALREQFDILAAQPGMEYLNDLITASDAQSTTSASTPQINWHAVNLAQDSWEYKKQGLTPAGAALVSLAVAFATGGAGGIFTTAGASAATGMGLALGTTAATVASAAITAGLTSLVTTATISLINNGGDISATLNELSSSANVQSLLTSVATAGVVAGLGSINVNGSPLIPTSITSANAASPFINQLGNNVINNTASALVSSAINGTSVQQNLENGFINAFITTGAAQGAFAIGTAAATQSINQFAQLTAHAVAGCIASAATNATTGNSSQGSASSACTAGALGAVVGELAAGLYDPTAANASKDTVQFAALMGGIAVAATGGNPAQIAAGAAAAGNAAQNNWLLHSERRAFNTAKQSCFAAGGSDSAACSTMFTLAARDNARNQALEDSIKACKGAECASVVSLIDKQIAGLGVCNAPDACPDLATLQTYRNAAQGKGQALESVCVECLLLDAKALFDLGRWGIAGLRALAGSATKSVADEAATALARIENTFYRDGTDAVFWSGNGPTNAATHWIKHSKEFPELKSMNEYVEATYSFFSKPPVGTATFVRPNGDKLFFDAATNTFGVQASNGAARTMFRPDNGAAYWLKQVGGGK